MTLFSKGVTAILLQFSFANWIIDYPIAVCCKLAYWRVWGGGGGVQGGQRGEGWGGGRIALALQSCVIQYIHAIHGEKCNHLIFHCGSPLAVATRD